MALFVIKRMPGSLPVTLPFRDRYVSLRAMKATSPLEGKKGTGGLRGISEMNLNAAASPPVF